MAWKKQSLKRKRKKWDREDECIYNDLLTNANFHYRLFDDVTWLGRNKG